MERLFTSEMEYKPALMRVMVGIKTNDIKTPYKYIVGGFKSYSDQYLLESPDIVEEGEYYAFIQLDWNNSIINKFSLWALGYGIKLEKADKNEWPNFLIEWIKDFARNEIKEFRTHENDSNIIIKHYLGDRTAGYGFHYYENKSKNSSTLIERVTYTKQEGISLLFKSNKQNNWYVEVKPDCEELLLFKRTEGSCSTNYSYLSYLKHTAKYLAKNCLLNGKRTEILNDQKDEGVYLHLQCKKIYMFLIRIVLISKYINLRINKKTNSAQTNSLFKFENWSH